MDRYIVSNLCLLSSKSDLQIITPNSAIASWIRKTLNSSLKISHYSLDSLSQNIVRCQGWGIASVLLSRRLLQNAVKEVIATKDIEGTAKAFLPAIKDLLRSGIDLNQLQQSYDPRIQQLASLAIAYQAQLRARKKIDAAQLYWQGAINVAYRKPYLFYGYFAPTKDELAVIDAIAGQDSVLVLPTSDLYPQNQQAVTWLESQGWEWVGGDWETGRWGDGETRETRGTGETKINRQLQECFEQKSSLPAGVKLNVFPNLEAEVRGVLTQVKVLLTQGVKAQDIVLVTEREQLYGETLIDIAWEYSLPLQITYEIPLEQTRMGAWLKLLLEAIGNNFPFEATAKLLSHPLAKYMSAQIWSTARQNHPQGLSAWQELGVDLSLLDFEQNTYRRDEWLQRLQAILLDWDVLEKGKYWAREIVAYYRLQEALTEISKPETQVLSKQAFINEISEILALLTVPAQPGTGGIELHNVTAVLGTEYPYAFVLGSGEGILPQAIADDAILDFYSRKELIKQGFEIETAIDIARRETFYFYYLLGIPTQQISFSYPELIDRVSILPSPYLTRLGLEPTPLEALPIASPELARQAYLRQANLNPEISSSLLLPKITQAWQVETQRETAIAYNEYDGIINISIDPEAKIFSASQLTQLGQCPFKWFSARLLKLRELPEAESDLSAAVRGSLYHRCLELSLSQIKTASDLAKFNQEQLAKAFAIAEQELNLTPLPSWEAQRQEHLNLLALNLATAEFLPSGREVVATETTFDTQWYGLKLQGQIDRIDRSDGGLTVIDYKTSGVTPAGVKDSMGKANIDIQLAVYQDAIAEQYPDEVIDTAAYYSLTKQKTISRPTKDPAELAEFAQRVKTHLQQGSYPVAPDRDRQACRYCDYDSVCRQGDRLSRKSTDY